MSEVVLTASFLDEAQMRTLTAIGERLQHVAGRPAGVSTETVAVAPALETDGAAQLAIGYSLAPAATSIEQAVGALVETSEVEQAVLRRFTPAEILFHWEDDRLAPAARGAASTVFASLPVDRETADGMRELVAGMLRDHKDGLIERARHVGYYREAMALARDDGGEYRYLLYLELAVPEYATVVEKIIAYPPTPFNLSWTPRFMELVGKRLVPSVVTRTALRWSDNPPGAMPG